MRQLQRKSGQIVAPGDRLGVIEEFTPGPGTYTKSGTIRSKILGRALLDVLNKKALVYSLISAVGVPRTGSTVAGQVMDVKSKTAILRISRLGNKALSGFFTGVLHVSDASPTFVESMFSVCKRGDLMRAKVTSDKEGILYLSTVEKDFGVMYAFCSRCGQILQMKKNRISCSSCGNIEKRKLTVDYGEGIA